MLISNFVESIREDFKNLAEIAGPDTAAVVARLAAALEPAMQKHFLDALNDLIQEFNVSDGSPLTLSVEGDAVRLTRLLSATPDAATSTGDLSARIALRLTDDLKENIEHLATDVGSSVNAWIVRSLERSVRSDPSGSSVIGKRQMRGKGRA